jgi:hypothetical protein
MFGDDDEEIDFEEMEYVTNRKLENDEGEMTGHIKMYSYDGEHFTYALQCPYCEEKSSGDIHLPKRPFWIPCDHCDRKSNVKRLKDAVEKENKS